MKVIWGSRKLQKKFDSLAMSNPRVSKRMISIKSAKNFFDLAHPSNGRAHFLQGNLSECFALDICCKENSNRYICRPFGNFSRLSNGDYDKSTITEFIIQDIKRDYH